MSVRIPTPPASTIEDPIENIGAEVLDLRDGNVKFDGHFFEREGPLRYGSPGSGPNSGGGTRRFEAAW
jgi:hypothetical protein